MMTNEQRLEWLRPLWERWLREAAESGGITVSVLQTRLDSGDAALQITATIPASVIKGEA